MTKAGQKCVNLSALVVTAVSFQAFAAFGQVTGAGHHSVVCLPGTDEWYICYHRRPIPNVSPNHRVVCLDRMRFEPDGSIRPVVMTGGVE